LRIKATRNNIERIKYMQKQRSAPTIRQMAIKIFSKVRNALSRKAIAAPCLPGPCPDNFFSRGRKATFRPHSTGRRPEKSSQKAETRFPIEEKRLKKRKEKKRKPTKSCPQESLLLANLFPVSMSTDPASCFFLLGFHIQPLP